MNCEPLNPFGTLQCFVWFCIFSADSFFPQIMHTNCASASSSSSILFASFASSLPVFFTNDVRFFISLFGFSSSTTSFFAVVFICSPSSGTNRSPRKLAGCLQDMMWSTVSDSFTGFPHTMQM